MNELFICMLQFFKMLKDGIQIVLIYLPIKVLDM